MKTVYRAEDGTLFESRIDAERRDKALEVAQRLHELCDPIIKTYSSSTLPKSLLLWLAEHSDEVTAIIGGLANSLRQRKRLGQQDTEIVPIRKVSR